MTGTLDTSVRFREIQRFGQKWLLCGVAAVSLGLIVLFGYGMVKQLLLSSPWGNRPMSDTALLIVGPMTILIGICLPLLFRKMKLLTEVTEDGVYVNFVPLARQALRFEDIVACEVRTYSPLREYGGWGVRCGRAGKAYNVTGNRGVQLKLSNGKIILIGSQRPEELAQAIQDGLSG